MKSRDQTSVLLSVLYNEHYAQNNIIDILVAEHSTLISTEILQLKLNLLLKIFLFRERKNLRLRQGIKKGGKARS